MLTEKLTLSPHSDRQMLHCNEHLDRRLLGNTIWKFCSHMLSNLHCKNPEIISLPPCCCPLLPPKSRCPVSLWSYLVYDELWLVARRRSNSQRSSSSRSRRLERISRAVVSGRTAGEALYTVCTCFLYNVNCKTPSHEIVTLQFAYLLHIKPIKTPRLKQKVQICMLRLMF